VTHALLLDARTGDARAEGVGAPIPRPGLPFIAAKGADAVAIFAAVAAAIAGCPPIDRATLHLRGLSPYPLGLSCRAQSALPRPACAAELTRSARLPPEFRADSTLQWCKSAALLPDHQQGQEMPVPLTDPHQTPVIEIRDLHKSYGRLRC
jgi:hypothetical protein